MNQPYDAARYRFVTAGLNWLNLDLRLTAWGGQPFFNPADKVLSDIIVRGTTSLLGTSQPITVKTVTADGTAQTNKVLVPNVPVGPDVTHFTMGEANGALILYIDQALDIPFTPNGLDIVIQPDWLEQRGWFRA
jgi:hypothetical protein